jgi:hypothetical protein
VDEPLRLLATLNRSRFQQEQPAAYQVMKHLLDATSALNKSSGALVESLASGAALPAIAASTLLGRRSSSGGSPEQINLGSGLLISGNVLSSENIITSTAIGTINDFAPGIVGKVVNVLYLNNAVDLVLNGIAAPTTPSGTVLILISEGAGQVYLAHNNAGSAAANRFLNKVTSVNTPLGAGKGTATLIYDIVAQRWRLISHDQGTAVFYVPSWLAFTVNPTLGNGSLSGTYLIRGNNLYTIINLTAGTTTTFGTGFYVFTVLQPPIGLIQAWAGLTIDAGGSSHVIISSYTSAIGGGLFGIDTTNNNAVSPTIPFAWAANASLRMWAEWVIT